MVSFISIANHGAARPNFNFWEFQVIFCSLLGDSSRKIIISSFLDFDFPLLAGQFVTDQIFVFFYIFSVRARVFGALPGLWMLYQVCGCFTRSHLGVLGPARSTPRHGRGTAAARRARKTVSHERGCGTAAARRQKKLSFTVPLWWVGQVMVMVVRYQIQIPRFARES